MKTVILTNESFNLYKTLCNLREQELQGTPRHTRLSHACFKSASRWSRRRDSVYIAPAPAPVSAGRPKKEDKKVPVGVKLPPWLNEWMKQQPESKATLIETALVSYYQIPDHLNPDKKPDKKTDEYQDDCKTLF